MTRRILRMSIVPLLTSATLFAAATEDAMTVTGTRGNDTLRGGAAADLLSEMCSARRATVPPASTGSPPGLEPASTVLSEPCQTELERNER